MFISQYFLAVVDGPVRIVYDPDVCWPILQAWSQDVYDTVGAAAVASSPSVSKD